MSLKALILAIVGTACVGAAAAGGYMALRLKPVETAAISGPAKTSTSAQAPAAGAAPAAADRVKMPGHNVPVPPATTPGASIAKPADARQGGPPIERTPAPVMVPPIESAGGATPIPTANPGATPATIPASSTLTDPPVQTPLLEPPTPVQEPVKPRFDEVTIEENAVVGIRTDAAVSSLTARVEDKIVARVARDVTVGGRTAIPAGAQLEGLVTAVERGGKFKSPGRLSVRFHTLVLADGSRVPLDTEPISRVGESPAKATTVKIGGGAVVGAILGGMIGGRKGAAIGTAVGAAGGTAIVAAGGTNDAIIPAGTTLTVRLVAPVTLLIERVER